MIPQGMIVLSFDLVSDGVFVIEADICDKIPLPGSEGDPDEKSSGEGQVADVVICALSLMGKNWPNCLREAWRILKAKYDSLCSLDPGPDINLFQKWRAQSCRSR